MNQQEIELDIEELNKLLSITTRPRIKDMLVSEIQRLKSHQIAAGESQAVSNAKLDTTQVPVTNQCKSVSKTAPQKYYKDITTYAWDQSDKFMKIYVTINGVQKLEKSKIHIEYTESSFQLKADDLDGANYTCRVVGLWGKLDPAECFHKVKTDTVLLMLKKAEEKKTWPYVTAREDKKRTPKLDEKKDPNEGLMDLLKNMYEDGDDEMKRTIAKAWTESRSKTTGDL